MKHVYKVGDKSKAICESCQQIVDTTMYNVDVADVNFNIKQNKMLVAKCDNCGDIVAIPNQEIDYEN